MIKKKIYQFRYENHIFNFYYNKNEDLRTFSLYSNEYKLECLIILIYVGTEQAIINNISNYPDCIPNKFILNQKKIGFIMLDLAIKFIKEIKDRYKIKKILLTDNSAKQSKSKEGNTLNIDLSKMYILLNGHTWYGNKGFKPVEKDKYDQETFIDGILYEKYLNNYKIIKNTLLKDCLFILEIIKKN